MPKPLKTWGDQKRKGILFQVSAHLYQQIEAAAEHERMTKREWLTAAVEASLPAGIRKGAGYAQSSGTL